MRDRPTTPPRAPDTELFNFHPPSAPRQKYLVSERPVLTLTPAPDTRLADGNATGNVVYVFNLKFVSRFGVDQHFRMSSEGWGDHELLMVRPENPEPAPFFFCVFSCRFPRFFPSRRRRRLTYLPPRPPMKRRT